MDERSPELRQVVDWSAAVWAGLVAGSVFLLANLFVTPAFEGGNAWVMIRLIASIVLGQDVLAPPASFHGGALAVALPVHYALSIAFAMLLALVVHRWGLLVAVLGGALFGLGLYCVNFYTLTLVFPWFFAMRSTTLVLTHVLFGIVAGVAYECLEVEEFVPVEG